MYVQSYPKYSEEPSYQVHQIRYKSSEHDHLTKISILVIFKKCLSIDPLALAFRNTSTTSCAIKVQILPTSPLPVLPWPTLLRRMPVLLLNKWQNLSLLSLIFLESSSVNRWFQGRELAFKTLKAQY